MEFLRYVTRRVSLHKGIGEAHAQRLSQYIGRYKKRQDYQAIIRDMLFHVPYDYIDRRHITPLSQAREGIVTCSVSVVKHFPSSRRHTGGFTPYRIQCDDDTGSMMLVFFRTHPTQMQKQAPEGANLIISGELQRYDGIWQMTHPDVMEPVDNADEVCRLDGVYATTEQISRKLMAKWIHSMVDAMPKPEEWLLQSTVQHHHWPDFQQALRDLHLPHDRSDIQRAQARLVYDEAVAHQLVMQLLRQTQQRQPGITLHLRRQTDIEAFIAKLPFTLTEGQQQVLDDIDSDIRSGQRMLRLLQGDVGAGKTIIALLAMLAATKVGHQAALMAPTEILARQHMQSIDALLGLIEVPVIFLAGSLTIAQREQVREQIRTCSPAMIIGTHALFQEGVEFASLGMVVIDEQHRFGVAQRLAMGEKAIKQHGMAPHMLLMTATPIPRSLAMTAYGDMDVSKLHQKPAGRQEIDTRAMPLEKLDALLQGVARAIEQGDKLYWICPLVEESISGNEHVASLQAAQARYQALQLLFPDNVGLVHGKMPMAERETVMQDFLCSRIQILVATTVVEVGVNVPDATIMVIENAERFGLAQLHQLRGRVGRSDKASRCILLYSANCSKTAQSRLKTMRETNDGFVIAEADMELRGSGDLLGTKQTGIPEYHFLDLEHNTDVIASAQQEASIILHKHAKTPQHDTIKTLLKLFDLDDATRYLQSG